MQLWSLLIVTAGWLLAVAPGGEDPTRTEKAKFQGTWNLMAVEINAQPLSMEKLKEARLTVKGDDYSFRLADTRLELTFAPDPTRNPKTLDLTLREGPDKGKVYRAIYQLVGDTLKICRHTEPNKDRPAAFGSTPNSGLMVVTWQRAKP